MPLPTHLQASLTQNYPDMVKLSPDDFFQLSAYLKHPDIIRVGIDQLREEARGVVTAQTRERKNHNEFHRYLRRILTYNEHIHSAFPNGSGQQKHGLGRPQDTDPKFDKQIFDAWQTKQYKKHEDLATEMNITAKDLKKALDRHRKRLANQE
jgi:hypothetical protein